MPQATLALVWGADVELHHSTKEAQHKREEEKEEQEGEGEEDQEQ